MDFEHAFQQTGFILSLQMMVVGSVMGPAVMGRSDFYRIIVGKIASLVVTFGPMAMLLYVLYAVSRLG
jgi:uncharacterized membrane protein YeaQ/YmgE (transglycosylase-associated protein family)